MTAAFDPRMWEGKMQVAAEEGWQVERDTGALLDSDGEFSQDTNKRRCIFRNEVAEISRTFTGCGGAASDDDDDSGGGSGGEIPGIVRPIAPENTELQVMAPHEASIFTYVDTVNQGMYTRDWCHRALEKATERWCPSPGDPQHYTHPVALACKRFRLDWDGVTMPPKISRVVLHNRYRAECQAYYEMQSRALQSDLFQGLFAERVKRICASINAAYNMLLQLSFLCDTWEVGYQAPQETNMFHYRPMDTLGELSEFHHLVHFSFAKLDEFRYRRIGEKLYQQVTNPDGIFVHTYKEVCTIKEFVYSQINIHERNQLWRSFCKEGNVRNNLISFLRDCCEPELPDLKKDRYVHSFRNGLYFIKEDRFHAWTDGPVNSGIVACKYHPHDFEKHAGVTVDFSGNIDDTGPRLPGTAYDIPTPLFDKILMDQRFPYSARIWLYVMLGRLLYWTREMDNWQIWMFHYGRAQVGKSTICQIFGEYFYDQDDIGQISNTFEKTFGLWAIHKKFGVYCSEVAQDFGIDRTELQQMISGERVSIRGKNLMAEAATFKAAGMLAGNYIPLWNDPHGAMTRRLLIWYYKHQVHVDQSLFKRIGAEIPALILKCNRFYRCAINYVGAGGIWDVLPKYFKEMRVMLQAETSSLHGFLQNEDLTVSMNADGTPNMSVYIPVAVVRDMYKQYKTDHNIKGGDQWKVELYTKALGDLGLDGPVKRRLPYPRDHTSETQQLYIFGMDSTAEIQRLESRVEPFQIRMDDDE